MSKVADGKVAEAVDRYLAAWNERNPARRRALVADTWTDEGSYVDPHRRGDGHSGIDAMIQAVQERFPTYRKHRGAADHGKRGGGPRWFWSFSATSWTLSGTHC